RYMYVPRLAKDKARRSALAHLKQTFFDGSTMDVVAALLDISEEDLSPDDYARLAELIDKARKEGR
ncbi:MAG: BlaI/MecI/CopY family transcriptional regulator, partial [Candidatus Aminicenantes bacterium]